MNMKMTAGVAVIISFMMMLVCIPLSNVSADGVLVDGGIISAGDGVTVAGDLSTGYTVYGNGTVTIENLVITAPTSGSSIKIVKDPTDTASSITLVLVGENNLNGNGGKAAISVEMSEGTLTIKGEGKLIAAGGSGAATIGGDSQIVDTTPTAEENSHQKSGAITINGGILEITSTGDGAAIGSGASYVNSAVSVRGNSANVTINSGSVTVYKTGDGAAIGSGITASLSDSRDAIVFPTDPNNYDSESIVTINGGTVSVDGGSIGAGKHGCSKVIITGGDVTVRNGNIGSNYGGSKDNAHTYQVIDITGGTIDVITYSNASDPTNASAPYKCFTAAIGSCYGGDAYVHIGGTAHIVNAVAVTSPNSNKYYQGSAGIGSGYHGVATILIDGSARIDNAVGSSSSPGIGSAPLMVDCGSDSTQAIRPNEASVTITDDSVVTAKGGCYAAGIGGGRNTSYMTITISGNANVTAIGGNAIADADITSYGGAGIGTGYFGTLPSGSGAESSHYYEFKSLIINISGNATVNAEGADGSKDIGVSNKTVEDEKVKVVILPSATVGGDVHSVSESSLITVVSSNGSAGASVTIDGVAYSFSGSKYIVKNSIITFTPVANIGYRFSSADNVTDNGDGTYSLKVNSNATVNFTFTEIPEPVVPVEPPVTPPVTPVVPVIKYYTVSMPSGDGFTAVAASSTTVVSGGSFSFTLTLNNGYNGESVTVYVNGEEIQSVDGVYTISGITSDKTITVSGYVKEYSFELTDGNGVVTPVDIQYVLEGQDLSVPIEVKDGYVIESVTVTVGGIVVDGAYADGIVTLNGINGDVSIEVVSSEIVSAGFTSFDWYIIAAVTFILSSMFLLVLLRRKKDEDDDNAGSDSDW
jgi:hypothetical protein